MYGTLWREKISLAHWKHGHLQFQTSYYKKKSDENWMKSINDLRNAFNGGSLKVFTSDHHTSKRYATCSGLTIVMHHCNTFSFIMKWDFCHLPFGTNVYDGNHDWKHPIFKFLQ